jgi:hypothetical protein
LNVAENAYIYKSCEKEPWEIIVTPAAKELSGENMNLPTNHLRVVQLP